MTELIIAFGAGLISFLSPCVLPLIPGYISFISGSSLNELIEKKKVNPIPLVLFSLGFSFVFIIFGAAASFLGQLLLENSRSLRIIAGLIIIIFSFQLIGIININFLNFEKKIYTRRSNNIWFSFIVGMAFGFGWTPCIGPILGSILVLASTEDNINKGVLLLSFYSLGLAIPFILSGYLIQRFMIISKNLKQKMNLYSKIGGSLLFLTGILIITNQLQALGFFLLKYIPALQNIG